MYAHTHTFAQTLRACTSVCVAAVKLATVGEASNGPRIGPFVVHTDAFAGFFDAALRGRPTAAQERSISDDRRSRPGLVVLDEIGAMQLLSPQCAELLQQTLDGDGSGDMHA